MLLADSNAILFQRTLPDGHQYPLVGTYYLANTDQPAPLALFLHGMPGSEKNHDLAQVLRAQGWHCLVIHFGGIWGSGGVYNLAEQPAEAIAALDFALTYERPINPQKIVAIGFSMGCRAALMAAHHDERIRGVVALAGFSNFKEAHIPHEYFENASRFGQGSTGASLAQQFTSFADGLQPYQAAQAIAPRPVLVVSAAEDEIVPTTMENDFQGDHIQVVRITGANHTFAAQRTELIQTVTDFVAKV